MSEGFARSDSRILVGEVLQQKKRPTLLFLCCPFLRGSWLLPGAQKVTIANISVRQNEYKVHHAKVMLEKMITRLVTSEIPWFCSLLQVYDVCKLVRNI